MFETPRRNQTYSYLDGYAAGRQPNTHSFTTLLPLEEHKWRFMQGPHIQVVELPHPIVRLCKGLLSSAAPPAGIP